MTEDQLWAQYVAKNPAFAGEGNVTMSAAGLRKLFSQTYAKGHDQGFANGKAWAETAAKATKSPMDTFREVFGGKAP